MKKIMTTLKSLGLQRFNRKSVNVAKCLSLALLLSVGFTSCKKDSDIVAPETKMSAKENQLMSTALPGDYVGTDKDINAALNNAVKNKTKEVVLKAGTYLISSPIAMKTGITLSGAGNLTTKLVGATTANGFAFILFNSVNNAGLKNLYIDGNVQNRNITNGSVSGIFIQNGSYRNTLDGLYVTNFGQKNGSSSGNFILIASSETDAVGCYKNIIKNCELIDNFYYAKFGIRFHTDWMENIKDGKFKNVIAYNEVYNIKMSGFTWNAIEIAGPATHSNIIDGCTVTNSKSYIAIEADKGAKLNTFSNNVVTNLKGSDLDVYAYKASGLTVDDGVPYDRISTGNKFINNKATNIDNGTSKKTAGGIMIIKSSNTVVENNTFTNIRPGSSNRAEAICLLKVDNISIKNNVITDVNGGVLLTGGYDYKNVEISNNTFTNVPYAYKSYINGVKTNIQFISNKLTESIIKLVTTNELASLVKK